jgi:hypothetical protein
MRQWEDCYDRNDTVVRLMCHSRREYGNMCEIGLGSLVQFRNFHLQDHSGSREETLDSETVFD